jgi:hypothetical protein
MPFHPAFFNVQNPMRYSKLSWPLTQLYVHPTQWHWHQMLMEAMTQIGFHA